MKLLFVCKYNAFRSRVAEEYFNKVKTNKKTKAISRGIIMGEDSDSVQREISKSLLGINIDKRKPLPLTIQDMKDADLVFVVADDIPRIVFNYPLPLIQRGLKIWKIKDEQAMNEKNIRNIVLKIKRKVDDLFKKLEKTK
jgi:protein-tyrosine-phosphatase